MIRALPKDVVLGSQLITLPTVYGLFWAFLFLLILENIKMKIQMCRD